MAFFDQSVIDESLGKKPSPLIRKSLFDEDVIRKSLEVPKPIESEITRREESLGFEFGDLTEAWSDGLDQTGVYMLASMSLASGKDFSESIALHFQNKDRPEYMQAYDAQRQIDNKKIKDAKGFWRTMGAVGETVRNIVKEPGALSYAIVENVSNFLPSLTTGAVGAVAGTVVPVLGNGVGFIVGMSAGTMATEAGAKTIELLQHKGVDMTDASSIRSMMNDDSFKREAAKQGLTKGAIIALVDAVTFKAGGRILSGPARSLNKTVDEQLIAHGMTKADVAKLRIGGNLGDTAKIPAKVGTQKVTVDASVIAARQQSAKIWQQKSFKEAIEPAVTQYRRAVNLPRRVRRTAGALGLESVGEGFGEFTGEYAATGEAQPAEALFEAISSVGQSSIQLAITRATTGTYKQSKRILKQVNDTHIERLRKGRPLGVDPSEIIEAERDAEIELSTSIEEVNKAIEASDALTAEIEEFETLLGSPQETRLNLDPLVTGIEDVEGFDIYNAALQSGLSDTFGPTVPLYVAVTSDERATLETPPEVTPTEKTTPTESEASIRLEEELAAYNRALDERVTESNRAYRDANDQWSDKAAERSDEEQTEAYQNDVAPLELESKLVFIRDAEIRGEQNGWTQEEIETPVSYKNAKKAVAEILIDNPDLSGMEQQVAEEVDAIKETSKSDPLIETNTRNRAKVAGIEKAPTEGYVVVSSDPAGLDVKAGTTVEEVEVPVENIVARGNAERGQYVARFSGITVATTGEAHTLTKREFAERRAAEEALTAKPLLGVAESRLGQIEQEEQLEQIEEEFEAGEREVEVEVSEKADPKKLTRAALRENKTKLARIPSAKELDNRKTEDGKRITRPVLGKIIVRDNIPTTEGTRGKAVGDRDGLRDDIKEYRKALENPDQMGAVNRVLKKIGYKIATKGKKKEITLIEDVKGGKQFGLGTIRVQERTIDEYLNLAEEVIIEGKLTEQAGILRAKEKKVLGGAVKVEKERPLDKGIIAENISTIEKRFVTRTDGKIQIDEDAVNKYIEGLRDAKELKYAEIAAIERGVKRIRKEAKIVIKKAVKPKEKTSVIVQTAPTPSLPGLKKIAKLAGNKLRLFHAKAAGIIRTGTRDQLLGKIADVYIPQAKIGVTAEEGKITPNAILTLSKTTDRPRIAKVYALAAMYIYSQPNVTWSLPNNRLNIDADTTSLGAYLRSSKILNDSQFGKLYKEVQRVLGNEARIVRVSQNEFVIHNDSINKSQFARRMGRLQAKFGETYGFQTEFYTAQFESVAHDWTKDPLGAGIRDQIRREGFGDLLSFVDNRRDAYLELAKDFGAKTEDLIFKEPVATPTVPKAKPRIKLSMPGPRPDMIEDKLLGLVDEAGFYSGAQVFFEHWEQKSAKGREILRILEKAAGLPINEIKEMGLWDFLEERQDAKVTRGEILDYIKDNRVYLDHELRQDLTEVADWAAEGDQAVQDAVDELTVLMDGTGNDFGIGYDTEDGDYSINAYITWEDRRYYWGDDEWYDYVDFHKIMYVDQFNVDEMEFLQPYSRIKGTYYNRVKPGVTYSELPEEIRERIETEFEADYNEIRDMAMEDVASALKTIAEFAQKNSAVYATPQYFDDESNNLHLPEGRDHKEILVKLGRSDYEQEVHDLNERGEGTHPDADLTPDERRYLRDAYEAWGIPEYGAYHGWPKQTIAWIRTHVRSTDPYSWLNKLIFHIDEMQSDWHHKGRDKGYFLRRGGFREYWQLNVLYRANVNELIRRNATIDESKLEGYSPKLREEILKRAWQGQHRLFDGVAQDQLNRMFFNDLPEYSDSSAWDLRVKFRKSAAGKYERMTIDVYPTDRRSEIEPEVKLVGYGESQPETRLGVSLAYLNLYDDSVFEQFKKDVASIIQISRRVGTLQRKRQFQSERISRGAMPFAPFQSMWQEMMMRRALIEAVRGNFNRVSWVAGETSAQRYDKMDWIIGATVTRTSDQTDAMREVGESAQVRYDLSLRKDHNFGETPNDFISLTEDELRGIVGTKLANRMIKDTQEATIEIPEIRVVGYDRKTAVAKPIPEPLFFEYNRATDMFDIFEEHGSEPIATVSNSEEAEIYVNKHENTVERQLALAQAKILETRGTPYVGWPMEIIYNDASEKYEVFEVDKELPAAEFSTRAYAELFVSRNDVRGIPIPRAGKLFEVRYTPPSTKPASGIGVPEGTIILEKADTKEEADLAASKWVTRLTGSQQAQTVTYTDLNEPFGAELHRTLYDVILPNFVRKLIKKFPGSTLEFKTETIPENRIEADEELNFEAEIREGATGYVGDETAVNNWVTWDIQDDGGDYKFILSVKAREDQPGVSGRHPIGKLRLRDGTTESGRMSPEGGAGEITLPDHVKTLEDVENFVKEYVIRNRKEPYKIWLLNMSQEMQHYFKKAPMYSLKPYVTNIKKPTQPPRPATSRFFIDRSRAELNKKFGKENIDSLESQGVLKIVSTPSQLPAHLIDPSGNVAEGIYDDLDETAYLIAENIDKGGSSGVLMHEVGVHFGLRKMLGEVEFSRLLVDLLGKKTDKDFQTYFDQVDRAYKTQIENKELVVDSEAYLEEVIAKIGQDSKASNLPLVEELYRRIRVFLSRYFPKINLTPQDIQAVVLGSLKRSMKARYTNTDIRQNRVYASMGDDIFNILKREDNVYKDFPPMPMWFYNPSKVDLEFVAESRSTLTPGDLKQARKRLTKALEHIQKSFNTLKVDGMKIDFNLDQTRDRGEKFVRVHNADGDMLIFRFALNALDSSKMSMINPTVDFWNLTHKNINLGQIDRAIKLFRDGKLKNQNTLSTYVNWRLGTPPQFPVVGLRPDDTYDVWSNRYMDKHFQSWKNMLSFEDEAVNNGFLKRRVTKVPTFYRHSMPSKSVEDLSDEQVKLIDRTTGHTKRWSLWDHLDTMRREKFLWFSQGAIDSYRSVKKKLGDDGQRAWMMMHLSDSSPSLMHAILRKGAPVEVMRDGEFDGYDVTENDRGIIEIMQGLGGEMDRFLTWMAGHRAGQLLMENREKNFTKDDIVEMKALSKGKIDGKSRALLYAKTMKELSRFQSSILDIAVNAGVINKEDRASLVTDFYIPFYREFEDRNKTKVRGPAMSGDFVNIRDVVHKLKGSELEVHDLFSNIIMNWSALLNSSMKNRAGMAAMIAAVGMGVATLLTDKQAAARVAFGKRKAKTDKYDNYVYVLKDGKKVWYEVHDPMVLQSLLALNWSTPEGKAIRVLSTFKRMFTFGVTASPAFKVRNLIRDAMHSIAVGDMDINIFENVRKGYAATAEDSVIYWSMLAGGGAFSFGFLHDDPSAIRRILKRGVKEARILDTPKKARAFLGKGWDAYSELGNRLENANRAALYMKRVGEVGHLQASFEARDLLNFSSHGNWVATQWLISSIGFLNARMQGMDKLGRSLDKKQRGRMLSVVGTLVLASVLYELSMGDDEEYKELPDWVRDTYWPIKIPGTKDWFYLPKPFEIGAITSVAQRFTQQFIDNSVNKKFFAKRTQEILTDQLAFDWRFQVFKPILEVATNYDKFRDTRIESLGWQISGKPKHKMKRAHSSDFSIVTSELFHDVFGVFGGDTPLSPVQIDHLIKGYFGWIGATTVGMFDMVLYPSEAPAPTKRIDDYRGLIPAGSFIGVSPAKSTKTMETFWDQLHEIRKLQAEYNDYKRLGLSEEAIQFASQNRELLQWRKMYNRVQDRIGKVGKVMDQVHESRTMTPDEKRERLDELIEMKSEFARKLVEFRRRFEEKDNTKKRSIIREAGAAGDTEDMLALQKVISERSKKTDKTSAPAPATTISSTTSSSTISNLYDSVFNAEFESGKRNAFIRTRYAPEGGSSAYGPLQITVGLMKSAKPDLKLTKKESEYVNKFIQQGDNFLKYGNEPDKEGYEAKYDYGGSGDLTSSADKRMYKQVGKKLLQLVWDQSDGDMNRFLTAWRYGEGSGKDVEQEDERYYKAFTKVFKTA